MMPPGETYDYVIVGAGSAGCVLANRLSSDPAVRVLLVESGGEDRNPLIHIPRAVPKLLTATSRHVSIHAVSPGGNRPQTAWLKGKGLGGSSSVNGMVYVRGHPADYDGWAALGCPGWSWADMQPRFAQIEDHALGTGGGRGTGGALKITMQPAGDPLSEAVLAAVEQAGTPRVADINDAPGGGFGYQPCTIWRGRRQSAARAFLQPVRARRNLTVVTGSDVLRVLFDRHRATGVTLRDAAGTRSVGARRAVILSAGALASPALLQRSGIGDARLLHGLGIPLLVDRPEVGRNLQEHLNYKAKYRVHRGSLNHVFAGWRLGLAMARYALRRDGPMARSVWEVGGFVKTRAGLARPDAQIGVGLYSMGAAGVDPFPGLTVSGYVANPASRGSLRITAADPDAPLHIDANFGAAAADRAASIALIRYIRRIAAQPALRPYIVREELPGPAIADDDAILDDFLDNATTAFHVCGTCRMGGDDAAVVDPRLRVRGVEGLRIVDTAIFPTLVAGNTNGPVMAVAMHAAEMILADRG